MKYQLEKYRGPQSRYCCPECGVKGCFTRYINTETGQYIHSSVGMCSRLNKCGYHYPPRQYYADNPSVRIRSDPQRTVSKPKVVTQSSTELCTIDVKYYYDSIARPDCAYLRWLRSVLGDSTTELIKQLYHIGSTEDDRAVFWQIDRLGQIRTAKVMAYDEHTGKRLKGVKGACDWMHSILKREGKLSSDWTLTQCLYGEHLLSSEQFKNRPIAIVESYKTAHIAAATLSDYFWMSVDNLNGLTAKRLESLKGRRVVLFPDAGAGYTEWSGKAQQIASTVGCQITVSNWLTSNLTDEQIAGGADIADVLIEQLAVGH